MLFRRLIAPILLAIFATFLIPTPGFSAEWDRFPELKPREHVAIKRRFDGPKYKELRQCYRRFDSRVGADYFGAMVDVTSETGSRSRKDKDATKFAASLFDAWKSERVLNEKTDILVVFGLLNRSIAIHPGSKWRQIGFDARTIEKTIDASHFKKHLKRRRYSDALCSLITAVDLRLVSLQQKMQERVAALEERLPELDEKLSALHEDVAARFADLPNKEHPFGQKLLTQLAAGRTHLDEAKKLAPNDPNQAVLLADKVEAVLQPVRSDLKTFNEGMEQLAGEEAEVAALKSRILERDDVAEEHPQLALLQVAKCEALAQKIRADYQDKPWQVRDCRRSAEVELARADVHRHYLKSLLPMLAAGLLILLIISFLLQRTLRRRRALAQLGPDLKEWQNRLDEAAAFRAELTLKTPTYFAPGREPWTGESAAIDGELGQAVARVETLLAQGRELVEKAQSLREKAHPLNARNLEKALVLLRNTPLQTDTQSPQTATAAQLLGRLDAARREALSALDTVLALQTRHTEQAARAGEALTRAEHALQRRRELGLPLEHLSAPLESAADAWQKATALSSSDPKNAADTFEHIAAQLGDIAERAELGNQVVERVRGELGETAEKLRQRVKQLRFAGIDIKKLSFDPEQELNGAKRAAIRIVEAVSRADETLADRAADQLEANLNQLAGRLEIVDKADAKIPPSLQEIASRSAAIKQQLMDSQYALKSLTTQGNPGDAKIYRAYSEQVGLHQAQIDRLGKKVSKARAAYQTKRLLDATELLNDATLQVERAEAFLDEIRSLEETAAASRTNCEQRLSRCKSQAEQLDARANKPGIDPELRTLITETLQAYQTLATQAANEQAHWLDAEKELDALQKRMAFLYAQAGADLGAFAQARELLQKTQNEFAAAQNAPIPAEYTDAFAQAHEMLGGWSRQMQNADGGGLALLHTGRATAHAIARALDATRTPRPLADVAHAQLAHANARYARVHGIAYGYDVTGNCTQADTDLHTAAEQLDQGDFAGALSAAEAATIQIDLEDARAHIQALRNYRRSQTRNLAPTTTPPNLDAFSPRHRPSGAHPSLHEPSEADA